MNYSDSTEELLQSVLIRIQYHHDASSDDDGQPPRAYYRQRVQGRQLSEILGIAKGILRDGAATEIELAFDTPLPTLMFDNWEYVVTGRFAYGPRRLVEKAISDRGGRLATACTRSTDVLAVGTFSSNAWLESTHGTKIQADYEIRNAGYPIRVVPEAHRYEVVQYDE